MKKDFYAWYNNQTRFRTKADRQRDAVLEELKNLYDSQKDTESLVGNQLISYIEDNPRISDSSSRSCFGGVFVLSFFFFLVVK